MFTELVPEIAMGLSRWAFSTARNDKPWASVKTSCHRERSVAICWQVFFYHKKVCRRFEIYFESPFPKKNALSVENSE